MLSSRVDCVAFTKIHWGMLRLGVSLWTRSSAVKVRLANLVWTISIRSKEPLTVRLLVSSLHLLSGTDRLPGIPEVRVQRGEHPLLVSLRGVQKDQDGSRDDLLCQQDLLRVRPNRSSQTGLKQTRISTSACFIKMCRRFALEDISADFRSISTAGPERASPKTSPSRPWRRLMWHRSSSTVWWPGTATHAS